MAAGQPRPIGDIFEENGFIYLVVAHVEHNGRLIAEVRPVRRA